MHTPSSGSWLDGCAIAAPEPFAPCSSSAASVRSIRRCTPMPVACRQGSALATPVLQAPLQLPVRKAVQRPASTVAAAPVLTGRRAFSAGRSLHFLANSWRIFPKRPAHIDRRSRSALRDRSSWGISRPGPGPGDTRTSGMTTNTHRRLRGRRSPSEPHRRQRLPVAPTGHEETGPRSHRTSTTTQTRALSPQTYSPPVPNQHPEASTTQSAVPASSPQPPTDGTRNPVSSTECRGRCSVP